MLSHWQSWCSNVADITIYFAYYLQRVQLRSANGNMDKCTNIYCTSKLPEPYKKSSLEEKRYEVKLETEAASNYGRFDRSRPQSRRARDNLRPEGEMMVSTELSSNFVARSPSRPASARDSFRRRHDNLRTEGQVRKLWNYFEFKSSFRLCIHRRRKMFIRLTEMRGPRYSNPNFAMTAMIQNHQVQLR